ncbi:hypothetical protein TRAPUB_3019 [Trametes pubescens]|uniref:Uncharacterized protein n=1 Tax=Trametes pubescens TaxID=154538 RepID=A0A1M2VES6_TRAPU|nr:hypothetical protein TRAPUB_3019 [Trametes pubescens]
MSLSTHSTFDASKDRSLLPWLHESSTVPSLESEADCYDQPIALDSSPRLAPDSPIRSSACSTPSTPSAATPLGPTALSGLSTVSPILLSPETTPPDPLAQDCSASPSASIPCAPPPSPYFSDPPPKNIEADLRATVDALRAQKKAAQRGLVDENAALREEVGFLRQSLRLCAPEDSDAKQLAVALEQERTHRLRSEEKFRALVDYLAEQVASGAERRDAMEKALVASERDCAAWEGKVAAALKRCEVLEEENLRVKSLLDLFARQRPTAVQQQMQGMLYEVAEERANLKKTEAIEQTLDKLRDAHPEAKKTGTMNYDINNVKLKGA